VSAVALRAPSNTPLNDQFRIGPNIHFRQIYALTDSRSHGLPEKVKDLSQYPVIPTPGPWRDELQSWFIEGLPVLSETVWFHENTGTLLLTDLLFSFGANSTGLAKLVARLLGVYDRLGMSLTMKLMTKDKEALRHSIEPLLSLPVQRVVLAHDQIIQEQPTVKLREAFEWLR